MSKFEHAPSTPAIERSPPQSDNTLSLVCLSCGDTMKHVRTIPKLGVRPELVVFVCPSCKEIKTKDGQKHAA